MNDMTNIQTAPAAVADEEVKKPADPLHDTPKFETERTFPLMRPVQFQNQNIIEIKLRAPTGFDIFEVKAMPTTSVLQDNGVALLPNTDALLLWLTRLSDYPAPVFYKIFAPDIRAMQSWVSAQLRASEGN